MFGIQRDMSRCSGKRPLPEQPSREPTLVELARALDRGFLFDVTTTSGEFFGRCALAENGQHHYVEPRQMCGLPVNAPMHIKSRADTKLFADALSRALRVELRR